MKKTGTIFAFLAILAVMGAFSQPLQADLIAYYSFDGAPSGYSVYGATQTNAGYNGTKAYSFDGNDYLSAAVDINPSLKPLLTMGAWVKATEGSAIKQIISHDNGGYDRSVGIDNRGGGLGWSAFSGSGGVLGYRPVTVDLWTFVAAVYNQTAGTVMLYIRDYSGVYTYQEGGTLSSGWSSIRIGSNPSYGEYFKGMIDDVFIYDEALTTAQLDRLSLSPHPVPIPGALMLLGSGLAGLIRFRRKA